MIFMYLYQSQNQSKVLFKWCWTAFCFCSLGTIPFETSSLSKNNWKLYDLPNDDNDPDGFPRHNANTVNNDSDDDGHSDDDDDNGGSSTDGAGTVDAADICGNEHVDKAETFSLSMHDSW